MHRPGRGTMPKMALHEIPSVPSQLYTLLRRETAPRNCIKMVRRASFSYAVPWEPGWHTGLVPTLLSLAGTSGLSRFLYQQPASLLGHTSAKELVTLSFASLCNLVTL